MPTWDGSIEAFDSYTVQVKYFLKSKPHWQRSQQIAKLIRNLKKKAWELIEKLPESSKDKLESSEEVYFGFLKKHLLEGEIPELGRCFKQYLSLRRQKRESMILYVMRNRVALDKLDKAMKIVEGEEILQYLKAALKGVKGTGVEEKESEEEWDEDEEAEYEGF